MGKIIAALIVSMLVAVFVHAFAVTKFLRVICWIVWIVLTFMALYGAISSL